MFVEEMLFILGHRDVEDVDAFVREMDGKAKTLNKIIEGKHWSDTHENYSVHDFVEMIEKADMLDRIEEMGVVTVYDDRHWSTDYNELKEKAEKWDLVQDHIIIELKTDPPSFFGKSETLDEFVKMKQKLEAVETQAKGLEGQLKAVKKTLITWVYHYPTKLREALERSLGEILIEEAIP